MEGQGSSKRKRKAYYRRCAQDPKRQKRDKTVLCPGMRGFFATCNHREVECLRELRNILTTVHGELEPTDTSAGVDQDDIAKAIENELREACGDEKNEKNESEVQTGGSKDTGESVRKQLFRQVRTNTKNCLFIHIPASMISNVSKFALRVFEHVERTRAQIARYTLRLLPISETCHADMESLRAAAKRLVETHFPEAPEAAKADAESTEAEQQGDRPKDAPKSFCCVFESRNNDSLFRQDAVHEVANVIKTMRSALVVDYKQPDVTVLIEVICNVICLGVAPRYAELRKYNLVEYGRTIVIKSSQQGNAEKPVDQKAAEPPSNEPVAVASNTDAASTS